jgi:2-methylisocitrate lyase-like PEP mutase family enzyme
MNLESQREKAEIFRSMHRGKAILVLPNAWDVVSARLFENEGFGAVATSSAGMLVSLGYQDDEEIDLGLYLATIKRIAQTLTVPLSADIISGFGSTKQEVEKTARGVIESGAVGINIEDFDHGTKKLHPLEKQLEKIKAIQEVSETMSVRLVINARTDAIRYADGDERQRFEEAIARCRVYRDAGADCVYPMGLSDKALIKEFVRALERFPTNVMIRKGLPSIKELNDLGVKRVSFGPSASYAAMGFLKRISRELRESGNFSLLVEDSISFDELLSLARKREEKS